MVSLVREAWEGKIIAIAATKPDKSRDESKPVGGEPTVLRPSQFVNADSFHKSSEIEPLFLLAGGSALLRLQNFMVTNDPDLHVLLTEETSPADRDELGEYLGIGNLKGNVGNQNYRAPDVTALNPYHSLVIDCLPFHVVFSMATFAS